MAQDFSWLGPSSRRPEPRVEYVCSFWTLCGVSGRNVVCSAYQTDVGMEPRTEYVVAS